MAIGATMHEMTPMMLRSSPVSCVNNRLKRPGAEYGANDLEFWAKNSEGLHEHPRSLDS
jgi:hypothetical protein